MAKQKESPEATTTGKVEDPKATQAVAASDAKKSVSPPAKTAKPTPAVPFARWFGARGFKPHWRGGMEAFADTTGKRTMEEWDRIFKNY